MAFGLSAGAVTAIGLGAGALLGGSSQSGSATSTTQQQLDPRIGNLVFGDGTDANKGLLSQYQALGTTPQNQAMTNYGQNNYNYLDAYGMGDMSSVHDASNKLIAGNTAAPTMQASSSAGAQVNAPSQNGVNLSPAYQNMIYGDAGANPYLTKALQSGVDQTNEAYQQNQTSLTNNLMRTVLPGIGDAAQAAGGYGGTRQGIAQANAISDYTNQLNNSNLQLGLANSANTTGQQANAYNQGQDRALSAMTSLSGNQYGTAQQNAQLAQNNNQFNAGLGQQASIQNQNSQLATNNLNSANTQAGMAGLTGALNNSYAVGGAQDTYALNKAGQVNNLMTPYLSSNSSSTTSQPIYTNQLGNALGGATAGLGLLNAYNKVSGGNTGGGFQGFNGGGTPGTIENGYWNLGSPSGNFYG